MKLESRFYLAAVALLLLGLVVGFLPLVGQDCGSPFVGARDVVTYAAQCETSRSLLRGPALACLALAVMSWVVGIGRWGFDAKESGR